MANEKLLNFRMGTEARFNNLTSYAAGTVYVTTDVPGMYLATADDAVIRIGGSSFISVANVQALASVYPWRQDAIYYCEDEDAMVIYQGKDAEGKDVWKQVNKKWISELNTVAGDLAELTTEVAGLESLIGAPLPTWDSKELSTVSAWLGELKNYVTSAAHGNEVLLDKIEALEAITGDAGEGSLGNVLSRLTIAEGNITTLQGTVSSHATTIAEHGEDIADHETRIGALETSVGELEGDLAEHITAFNTHVEKAALKTEVSALETSLTGSINGVSTSLAEEVDRAKKAEGDLAGQLTTVSGVASGAATKAAANESAISTLGQTVSANKTDIEGKLTNAVTELTTTIDTNKTDIEGKLNTEITNRTNAISALDTAYKAADTGLSNRITTLEDSLKAEGTIGSKVAALETTVGQHTSSITDLNTTVGEHTTAIGNINTDLASKATTAALEKVKGDLEAADVTINGRIDTVAADLVETDKNVAKNAKDITDLTTLAGEHTTAINGINGSITTIQTELDKKATISALDTAKQELQGNINTVSGNLAKTDENVAKNAKDITDLTTALDTYKTTVSNTYATKEALQSEATTRSTEDSKLAARIAVFEADGANDVAALTTRVTNVESKASTNEGNIKTNTANIQTNAEGVKAQKERIDAILADSSISTFKGVEEAIAASFAANDAMVFKGVINSASDFPSAPQSGWTYKVATAGSYQGKDAKVGDLFIYVDGAWKYVPSGNEDRDTISIGSANAVITVNSQLNDETGSVTFVSGSDSLVVDGSTANQIAISMVWGEF